MKLINVLFLVTISSTLSIAQLPSGVNTFKLDELKNVREQGKQRWLKFLDEPTIEAGIYHLDKGAPDPQPVHEEDEIYYVLAGDATLHAADTSMIVKAGSIIYVRARVKHYFDHITSDLDVLVLFPKTVPSGLDRPLAIYALNAIESRALKAKNTWEPFLQCSTMNFGLYMLPERLGGDSTKIHRTDELNVVLKGEADFTVDNKHYQVKPGDLIFVPKGMGHYFHNLKGDFEVFILFEKKSLSENH